MQSALRQTDAGIKNLANNSVAGAGRIGGAFAGAGKLIALGFGAVAVAGMAKVGTGFLMLNANAEQLRVQLDIATGSAEKTTAIFGELKTMAAQTPFEFPELVSASARIESFGQDSLAVMGTIGDTAAGTGRSLEQVTNAYLDAGMGQFIRLQELGIDAQTVGDQVVLSYVENGKTIRESVDKNNGLMIQSTVSAIWNKRYAGAMKKQSKTFLGQWSTLKDNFNMTMQDMTKGVFEFAKGGLGAANRFFDQFNDKRAQGFGAWDAALMSLRTTLNQTLGPSAGGVIIGVIEGIGTAVSTVTDIIGGMFEAFGTGRGVAAIFADMPGPIRGVAEALGSIADALGDVWRGFQADGFDGALRRLGEEARQIASAGIDLGVIAINAVFELASGVVKDIWGWFKGKLGLGPNIGDGTDVALRDREFSFGTVIVTAALKLGGQIAEWAGNLWGWVKGQLGLGAGLGAVPIGGGAMVGAQSRQTITIGSVIVDIANFLPGVNLTAADVSAWIQGRLDLLTGVSAELAEWKLIIFGPEKVEAGANAQSESKSKVQRIVDGWNAVNAKMAWIAEMDPTPKIEMNSVELVSRFNDFMQRWVDGQQTINVPFGNWELKLLAWRDIQWDAGVPDKVAAIRRLVENDPVEVPLGTWNLLLESPQIKGIGGIFGAADLGLVAEIAKVIGVPSVSLSGWKLDLPAPDIDDLSATVEAEINFALDLIEIAPSLAAWALDLAVPDLPDISMETVVGWIVDALPGGIKVPIEWALDLGAPAPPTSANTTSWGSGPGAKAMPGASGGGNAFGGLLPGGSNFGNTTGGTPVAPPPIVVPAPDLTAFNAAWATVPTTIGTAMSTALGAASTYATAIYTAVSNAFGLLVGNATALMGALAANVGAAFGSMSGNAQAITAGMANSVVGILNGLAGSGAGAAYNAGISIGAGLANGLAAMQGQVAANAAALANAAAAAVVQAARISSPSKVFAEFGSQMGAGLALGLLGAQSDVSYAGGRLAAAAVPSYAYASRASSRGSQGRSGDTYIIQGDLLGQRDWEQRVKQLAEGGMVRVVDNRLATSRRAER